MASTPDGLVLDVNGVGYLVHATPRARRAAEAFPVFNGTGGNVTALPAVLRPFDAVICPETAHINVDECGAPERIAGAKLVDVPTQDGKLTPELLGTRLVGFGDERQVRVRLRVDRHGPDAQPAGRGKDPPGDLPAVGDQDALEHTLPQKKDEG